jgi:hypothetical protein
MIVQSLWLKGGRPSVCDKNAGLARAVFQILVRDTNPAPLLAT